MLITEASAAQETVKSGKKEWKKVSTAMGGKRETETHVELDSRILSALLTVSFFLHSLLSPILYLFTVYTYVKNIK